MFVYKCIHGTLAPLLHIDDIIITSYCHTLFEQYIRTLSYKLAIKCMVLLAFFFFEIEVMLFSTLYQIVVGALQYLTLAQPYISHAINFASQFMHHLSLIIVKLSRGFYIISTVY